MIRTILGILTALFITAALAITVQEADEVVITTPSGDTVIGAGSVFDGRLSLTLLEDFNGFAQFVIHTDGATVTHDVFIEDGAIRVITAVDETSLEDDLRDAGITLSIEEDDDDDVREALVALERAREVANEQAEDGLDRADDAVRGDDDDDDIDDGDDIDDDRDDGDRDDDDEDDRDDRRRDDSARDNAADRADEARGDDDENDDDADDDSDDDESDDDDDDDD